MNPVREVNRLDEFEDILKEAGQKLVLVDFYAAWCGSHEMISPKMEEMVEEFPDVVFLRVDVDQAEEIAMKYIVSFMPTLIVIKNCKRVEEIYGADDRNRKLRELIEKHAAKTQNP